MNGDAVPMVEAEAEADETHTGEDGESVLTP